MAATTPLPRRTFPSAPKSIALVREFVVQVLGEDHPLTDDAMIVAAELSTNAYQHTASPDFSVTITIPCQGEVTIDVGASAVTGSQPHVYDGVFGRDGGESGRGMSIVQALAACWGYRMMDGRQSVFATLQTPEQPAALQVAK